MIRRILSGWHNLAQKMRNLQKAAELNETKVNILTNAPFHKGDSAFENITSIVQGLSLL